MEYLALSYASDPSAIEVLVCEPLSKRNIRPLTKEESEILVTMILGGGITIPEKEKPFLVRVIQSRVKACFTYALKGDAVAVFLAMITMSPGAAVLMLWYLQWWCFHNNIREIDLNLLCERVFPMGVFSQEVLSEIWNAQKIERPKDHSGAPDNLVDYAAAGLSIQFKVNQNDLEPEPYKSQS